MLGIFHTCAYSIGESAVNIHAYLQPFMVLARRDIFPMSRLCGIINAWSAWSQLDHRWECEWGPLTVYKDGQQECSIPKHCDRPLVKSFSMGHNLLPLNNIRGHMVFIKNKVFCQYSLLLSCWYLFNCLFFWLCFKCLFDAIKQTPYCDITTKWHHQRWQGLFPEYFGSFMDIDRKWRYVVFFTDANVRTQGWRKKSFTWIKICCI